MTRRLRLTRKRERAAAQREARALREFVAHAAGALPARFMEPVEIDPEQAAEWQRVWDEAMADDPTMGRIIHLPQRPEFIPPPRKSPPRGVPRMRKHRRELLINALRWDGPYAAAKAYRILPDELGLGADRPTGQASVDAAFAEHVIEPTVRALPRLMGLPDGIEFRFEPDTDPTDPNGATDS